MLSIITGQRVKCSACATPVLGPERATATRLGFLFRSASRLRQIYSLSKPISRAMFWISKWLYLTSPCHMVYCDR